MPEFNPDTFKIPVVSGINDAPLPPNFQGNGKGCNGAYYVEKFNTLVDFVSRYWERARISAFNINLSLPQRRKLVGERLVDMAQEGLPVSGLEFSYEVEGIDPSRVSARIYTGTDVENLEPFTPYLAPEQTHTYFAPDFNQPPNSYNQPTTIFWQVVGEVDEMFSVKSEIISATWALPVIIGLCERGTGVVNSDNDFTTLYTAPELEFFVDIDPIDPDQYLYVFSPTQLEGILLDDVLVSTTETQGSAMVFLESTGANASYPYWIYRTSTQGIGGVRVSLAKY